jgi:hypothetical protein
MFLSTNQIQRALNNLQSIHPFYGTIFLACKKEALPVGKTISFPISIIETQFLDDYYRPDITSEYFYRVFRVSKKDKKWMQRKKYASSTLQGIRTQSVFSKAFIHDANSDKWGWQKDYIATLKSNLSRNSPPYKNKEVPIIDLAIWLYRNREWPRETKSEDLVSDFLRDFRIEPEERDAFFDLSAPEPLLYNEPLLQEQPVTWRELREIIGPPPDSKPEEGAALQFLELRSIGPVDVLRYEPAERLNIITGDNSLGKTFILETIWWALTGEWPEYPAMPRRDVSKSRPRITFAVGSSQQSFTSDYNWDTQTWKVPSKRSALPGVVIYARYDGSFAVWDPAKLPTDQEDGLTRRHLFFDRKGIWDGLPASDGYPQGPWLCNGLIRDWVTWQMSGERYREHYNALVACLRILSPSEDEPLIPGQPTRISRRDSRDFPTLRIFGNEVPVVLASAGIQRIIAFAYLLVWTWQEHLANSEIIRRRPQRRIVLIVDEIEAHLHPRWQRMIVRALVEVASRLETSVSPQLHVVTHSPMIMASTETVFDEDIDDLHHLKLEGQKIILEELSFIKRGRADLWLMSEVFGLSQPRSLPAEQAINDAKRLQLSDNPLPEEVREVNTRLLKYLAPDDEFWPRWRFFAENLGVDQ